MLDLQHRQQKIQEKRKKTPFRDFVKEICSRFQVSVYRTQGVIARFPETERCGEVLEKDDYLTKYIDGPEGMDIDPTKTFFEQFQEFFAATPKMALLKYGKNENVTFADTVYGANNAYMSISVGDDSENVIYSCMVFGECQDVFSSFMVTAQTQNIYHSKMITTSHNIFYSKHIHNSSDIWFSDNLIGCRECLFCSELENQQYCIANQKYEKDVYLEKKAELLAQKDKFEFWYTQVKDAGVIREAEHVTGNAILFSHDIEQGYMVTRVGQGRNVIGSDGSPYSENQYDLFDGSLVSDVYGWMGVGQHSSHLYCGANAATCNHIFYSYFLHTCNYCLGCIGLKNKQFCIFNKQYTKEERHKKVDEIFTQMEKDGDLGKFFPGRMNPFYFNDTAAYLIDDSFMKEEVEAEGYLWRDEEIKVDIPEGMEVVDVKDLGEYEGRKMEDGSFVASSSPHPSPLPTASLGEGGYQDVSIEGDDKQRWINPEILKKVIRDEKGNYYRIVQMEYDFLMKHSLPLPRLHWLDRLKQHFKIE